MPETRVKIRVEVLNPAGNTYRLETFRRNENGLWEPCSRIDRRPGHGEVEIGLASDQSLSVYPAGEDPKGWRYLWVSDEEAETIAALRNGSAVVSPRKPS